MQEISLGTHNERIIVIEIIVKNRIRADSSFLRILTAFEVLHSKSRIFGSEK